MSTCTAAAHVISSGHTDGVILLDRVSGCLFTANAVGGQIWRSLEQRQSPATIARHLSERHQISFDVAEAHTTRFIAALAQHKLVNQEGR